ncbi:hypothetical protein B0H34DRAFT_801050 [Crassisporium funariophilum]|nr:hypothetical protein B0H34DRAFT_801050 [Crassisporium funariophilum]
MRVGGFLITPEEARRWYSQQHPGSLADDANAITLLGEVDEDKKYLIPTRRAHFSRQMFRDIDGDALQLEPCKWGEQEDIVHKLIEEHGLKADEERAED